MLLTFHHTVTPCFYLPFSLNPPIDVTHWDVDILQMQHDSSGLYGSTFSTKMLLEDIQVHLLSVSH